jgi:non-ribosomal peptide synthetase component E (peptide arylation enzyme)
MSVIIDAVVISPVTLVSDIGAGSVTSTRWLTVLGRTKDIINRGGEKFPAGDIEAAILDHPAVVAAAVVGAPEPRLGEQVVAFVVLRAGASWPGDAALVAHLNDLRLARQKMPVAWRVLDALPATPTGKIRKNVLLERWNQTDSGVITS